MGLFDPKVKSLEPAWQKEGRENLAGTAMPLAAERLARAGETYGGKMTAGMSDAEKASQSLLSKYLSQPGASSSPLFKSATDELQNILGDKYDPVGGEYFNAYRTAVMRELGLARDALASRMSASDQFFGGGRLDQERQLQEGAVNTLAQELGRLESENLNRKASVIPTAISASQVGDQEQLSKVAAAQQFGALPRQIEQAGLDAEYQEWLRSLSDLGIPLDTYLALATYKPPVTVSPSLGSELVGLAGAVAGAAGNAGGFGSLFS